MNTITNEITQAMVPVILAVITALAGIVVSAVYKGRDYVLNWIDSKTSNSERDLLHKVAAEAFAQAEALYLHLSGPARLQQAIAYASATLEQRGVQISPEEISAAINKAWLEDKRSKDANQNQVPPDPSPEQAQSPDPSDGHQNPLA